MHFGRVGEARETDLRNVLARKPVLDQRPNRIAVAEARIEITHVEMGVERDEPDFFERNVQGQSRRPGDRVVAANDQRQVLAEVTPAEFDWTIGVNLKHVFFAAQAVVPQMQARGGGSIINMSSVAWIRGAPALPVYAAAKAAIVGFTNSLARVVGPNRIRVNAIAPGMVITERQRRLWYPDEKQIVEMRTRQAIPDAVTPDDIARVALFLASDESQRITRQCFTVDGGL